MLHHCVISSHTHYGLAWVDGRRRDSERRRENREVSGTKKRGKTHVDQQLPVGITNTLMRQNSIVDMFDLCFKEFPVGYNSGVEG